MTRSTLGEFEQMVLLAILQQRTQAFGLEVRREIELATGRRVSRGAFYTTLDRLERKGLVDWSEEAPAAGRGGAPLRRFVVTSEGLTALRTSRQALRILWSGLDDIVEET